MKKVHLLPVIVTLFLTGNVLCCKEKDHLPGGDWEVRGTGRRLSVLLISLPDAGLFFKLAAVGSALVLRGHNVSLCTTEKDTYDIKEIVTHSGMNFISAGPAQHSTEEYVKQFMSLANHPFKTGITIKHYYANISQQILVHLNTLEKDWDIIIIHAIFFSAVSCFTSYYQWNIPIIITSSAIDGVDVSHPPWSFPNILTDYTDNVTFWQRLHLKVFAMAHSILYEPYMTSQYSRLGLDCSPYYGCYRDGLEGTLAPLIVFNAIGFEYPRPLPPLIHFVGPVVLNSSENLPAELKAWLAKNKEKSVVYVTMGSWAHMSQEMGTAIIDGILGTNFSAVWSLRRNNQDILDGRQLDPSRFFVSHWLPQRAVLKSKAIAMTITHGGMGGVTESLYQSIPLIVVPFGIDQLGNAARLASSGAGVYLEKDTLTAEKVQMAIETVASPEYRKAADKLKKIFVQAGGADKAAELVEFYQEVGYEHLVPAYAKYNWSWVQYYNVDVYAILLGIFLLVLSLFFKVIGWAVRRCSARKTKLN